MTTEEKARAYDEAVKKVKDYYEGKTKMYSDIEQTLDLLFPGLKESEDGKIRKGIIELVKQSSEILDKKNQERMLAWLEKQGKSALEAIKEEKICNQNCVKPADKIVPQFKVGDWVVDEDNNSIHQIERVIENITTGKFVYGLEEGGYFPSTKENYHLWTIADAKNGDILACESGWTCIFKTLVNEENFSSYCFMDKTKWFCETGSECHTLKEEFIKSYNGKIYPATKEQRDTLFATMKEAGYEWNEEKKELRKIEQSELTEFEDAVKGMMNAYRDAIGDNDVTTEEVKKHATYLLSLIPHKSAEWSEEDERFLNDVDFTLFQYKDMPKEHYWKIIDWLKSIKKRMEE